MIFFWRGTRFDIDCGHVLARMYGYQLVIIASLPHKGIHQFIVVKLNYRPHGVGLRTCTFKAQFKTRNELGVERTPLCLGLRSKSSVQCLRHAKGCFDVVVLFGHGSIVRIAYLNCHQNKSLPLI